MSLVDDVTKRIMEKTANPMSGLLSDATDAVGTALERGTHGIFDGAGSVAKSVGHAPRGGFMDAIAEGIAQKEIPKAMDHAMGNHGHITDPSKAHGFFYDVMPGAMDHAMGNHGHITDPSKAHGFFYDVMPGAGKAAGNAAEHAHSMFGNDAMINHDLGSTLMAGAGMGTLGLLLSKIRGDNARIVANELARQEALSAATAQALESNKGIGDHIMDGISGAATKIKDWWDGK